METYKRKFSEEESLFTRENDVFKDKITKAQKSLDSLYYDLVEILSDSQEIDASEFLAMQLKKYRDLSYDIRVVLAEIKKEVN